MAEGQSSADAGDVIEMIPAVPRSDSFCIRLWRHMRIETNGEARVCCAYDGDNIMQDGVLMSINRQSVMEIWNSDMMRGFRRDMVEGRRIPGCKQCYADEARGGVSMRMRDNEAWQQGFLNEEGATIDEVVAQAVDTEFRLPNPPEMIEVETGNLCNLKCRMCNGDLSSLIAKDPVHHKWADDQAALYHDPEAERKPSRFRPAGAIASLGAELSKDTDGRIKRLYFIGGEPLVVREVRDLIQGLVSAGRAPQIALAVTSNGTVAPPWLSLASQFRNVDIAVSVDGYGQYYDYIRYPGCWSDLVQNLHALRAVANLHLRVTTTLQANNALNITQLFRYLDSVGIGFTGYLLHWPRYLAVSALPVSVRRVAADRLTEYAKSDCRPENRALILSLAAQFEAGSEAADPGLIRDFMLFTNDLDASRGQSIHRTDPELVELLAEAGFPWLYETVHAPAPNAAEEVHRWRDALMNARSTAHALEQELIAARNAATQLERDLAGARSAVDQGNRVQHELQEELSVNRGKLALSEEDAVRSRLELAQVYASHSWRATRPYRVTRQALRRWLQSSGVGRGRPGSPS